MRLTVGWICLGLLLGLLAPATADEKKTAKKPEKPDKQEAREKLVPIGSFVCQIARVEGAQKVVTIRITQPVLQAAGLGLRIVQATRDIEVPPSDDMKVRILQPPADFDEKGRPKRYKAKELKEMKGDDPKLPGYTADFDSLKPDQIVKVYLSVRKETGKSAAKSHGRGKDKDKEQDGGTAANKPEITMVVIIAEPKK